MIVAIHQPNYFPWLGYFVKMARADIFVFLDDVQYSKNSYINRVQIDATGKPRWLTIPVHYQFGDAINRVIAAGEHWPASHVATLRTFYAGAPAFKEVSTFLDKLFAAAPMANIAATNQHLIEGVASRLELSRCFKRSSELQLDASTGDDRLISILRKLGPKATYLSGKGGANYQDSAKFEAADIGLLYNDFTHPAYDQGRDKFLPGLSILDSLFRVGFEGTAALLK